jgi:hypothetical protein
MDALLADYHVAYDAAQASFHTWKFSLAGLIFVAVGVAGFLFNRGSAAPRERALAFIWFPLAAAVGACWTTVAFVGVRSEYTQLRDALANGAFTVVEGTVTAYVPEGAGGHPPESWTVDGHSYVVSTYVVTSGLEQPGLVKAGDRVRIADVDGHIARLETTR